MSAPIIHSQKPDDNAIPLEFLGDQGVLAHTLDEATALALAAVLRQNPPTWLEDVVQAYTSVAVFYDSGAIAQADVVAHLGSLRGLSETPSMGRSHEIPCCYELGLDLDRIVTATGLAREAVIAAHSETLYTVYAIGFCPGFPYLGYLPESLRGVPRLATPRVRVEPGSVGLTGKQTGIYTEPRPGGWSLVGRTPLVLVDVAGGFFPLRTGDRVRFVPISAQEYQEREGERLLTADQG